MIVADSAIREASDCGARVIDDSLDEIGDLAIGAMAAKGSTAYMLSTPLAVGNRLSKSVA